MRKYIDAVGLKIKLGKRLSDDERRIMEIVKETIDSMPTIDIVHCRDCKRSNHELSGIRCGLSDVLMGEDGFCSIGERRAE